MTTSTNHEPERCQNCGKSLKGGEVLNCDVCRGLAYPTNHEPERTT